MDDDSNDDIDILYDEDKQTPPETPETPVVAVEGDKPPEAEDTKDIEEAPKADEAAGDTPPPVKEGEAPAAPSEPPVEEAAPAAKPLTAEEARQLFQDIRTQERDSAKSLEEAEREVLNAYYPQGLSNTLVDEKSGREIRSPQDVVDLSDGTMTIEEASQWLMNEQYKLDKQVSEIKQSARDLAETNSNFKQGAVRVLEKYQPIFDKYPSLQGKVYRNYMKTVKMDGEKDLVLAAPDIEDYYADVMEPYVMAFSYQAPPTAAPVAAPAIPESKQTAADRMDVGGDGGSSGSGGDVDPNDADASLNKFFGE